MYYNLESPKINVNLSHSDSVEVSAVPRKKSLEELDQQLQVKSRSDSVEVAK